MLTNLKQGDLVATRGGGQLMFIAFVPEAAPAQQVVMLDRGDRGGDILTFWADGVLATDRSPSGLDLII